MNSINRAERLLASKNETEVTEGLNLLNELSTFKTKDVETRFRALKLLMDRCPQDAESRIAQSSSILMYARDKVLEIEKEFLLKVIESNQFKPYTRISISIDLLLNGFIDVCYNGFIAIATDESVDPAMRVEAIKFLLSADTDEYQSIGKERLKEIVCNHKYSSDFRYRSIAAFNTEVGISSCMMSSKLYMQYDEDLLRELQLIFFFDFENGYRERVLSGQHLLQMSSVSDETKARVIDAFFEFASDKHYTYNERADAADVVFRLTTDPLVREEIKKIIVSLGSEGDEDNPLKTVYDNAQNVHDEEIAKSVEESLERLIEFITTALPTYKSVNDELQKLVYEQQYLTSKERISAFQALNRISIDSATYTKHKITASIILILVWLRINSHPDDIKSELLKRLIEELVDMADTCGSGHMSRIVNVLSYYDKAVMIKISYEEQLKNNIKAKIYSKIRAIDDEELQNQLISGIRYSAEQVDRDAFLKFLDGELPEIRSILHYEFIEDGQPYLTEEVFSKVFDMAVQEIKYPKT